MTRPRRVAVALTLLAGLVVPAGGALAGAGPGDGPGGGPAPGSFTEHSYPAPGAPGAREYWLYVPAGPPRRHLPVVVFLHGCNETAPQAAVATRFDALADQRGFLVVYPQENVTAPSTAPLADGNGIGCWNWFLPQDQVRGSGEAATIAGITEQVVSDEQADPDRVYVEGISAGADMSVILAASYPDVFAAVGVWAGCAYATCADASGELAYAAMGPRKRIVPLFVENGTADTANPFPLAVGLVASWLGVDDLADDGAMNGSVSRTPSSVTSYDLNQTPVPGSGDPCVHNDTWTCPGGVIGFQGSYPYTVSDYTSASGCELIEFVAIHGMEHAIPDGPAGQPYTDPLGPDMTAASYDFFLRHPLSGEADGGGPAGNPRGTGACGGPPGSAR